MDMVARFCSLILFALITLVGQPLSASSFSIPICEQAGLLPVAAGEWNSPEGIERQVARLTSGLESLIFELRRERAAAERLGTGTPETVRLQERDDLLHAQRCADRIRLATQALFAAQAAHERSVPAGLELLERRLETFERLVTGEEPAVSLTSQAAALGTGSISGTVTDEVSGAPLSGIEVRIYNADFGVIGTSISDASGGYAIANLDAGTYFALAGSSALAGNSSDVYIRELYDDIPCPTTCNLSQGTPINLQAGAATTGIDFALSLGGSISGTVTELGAGTAIPSVLVYVVDGQGKEVGYRSTDAAGHYTIKQLPPGSVFASTLSDFLDELYDDIPCPGANCDRAAGTPITVTAGATTTGIDFVLARGNTVSGHVFDASNGNPLTSVDVFIYHSAEGYITVPSTDTAGSYTASGIPAGTVFALTSSLYADELYENISCPYWPFCDPTTGTPITVTEGTPTSGIDFLLGPGGVLSGAVTDASTGDPLASVRVTVSTDTGGYLGSADSDAFGNYSVGGLPTGFVFVEASFAGFVEELYDDIPCPAGCSDGSGTPIAVTDGFFTSGVDFALAPAGKLSGTVVEEASGAPVSGAGVAVFDTSTLNLHGLVSTDTQGNYLVEGLPPGNVYVKTASKLLDELFDDVPCPMFCGVDSATPVTVTAGATTPGIDFALKTLDIFTDGFEAGNTSSWSSSTGVP